VIAATLARAGGLRFAGNPGYSHGAAALLAADQARRLELVLEARVGDDDLDIREVDRDQIFGPRRRFFEDSVFELDLSNALRSCVDAARQNSGLSHS